ncbi:MAG: hypothetical protein JXA13_06040 [Anaerolineales bacterium]|nr:hypothetical protein [Anaerolineales bacterium]
MFNLTWIEIIYWAATIVGGTLFILRTIMLVAGGGFDHTDIDSGIDAEIGTDFDPGMDADTGVDTDLHADAGADTDHGSDASFKFLSLQSLTAFFMIFGLVGLALFNSSAPGFLTFLGSASAGLLAAWLISWMLNQLLRLQSDGTIQIHNAIGEKGSVYLTVPAKGSGQVQVAIQGALKIYDAISADDKKILTGDKIQVTGVENNQTLIVKKVA